MRWSRYSQMLTCRCSERAEFLQRTWGKPPLWAWVCFACVWMLDEIRGVGGHVVCLPWWFLHSAGCRSFSRVLVHCCILFHWAHGPFTVVKSVQMHSLWCRFVCLSNLLASCSLCCHLSFYISLLMYLFFFCFVYFISFPFSFLLSFPVTFLLPFISLYLYFYISSFIILPFLFCLFLSVFIYL